LLDHSDEFVARRKRRFGRADRRAGDAADIGAGAEQRVGERDASRQDTNANFAAAGAWIGILYDPQHLGAAKVIDDDALHWCRKSETG